MTAAEHHDREGDARIDPGVACTLDELLPLVRRRIEEIRATRRLPDDVELGLRAAGVNRMLLPAELGGLETPTSAIIGAASNIFAGYLRIEGAAEVFADPDRSRATRFAPLGTLHESPDGSLRLDGRWPFVSNCHHAEWIGLGATLRRDRGGTDPVPRLAFVRAADITIEDTWDVVGLRGTGSHHVTATNLAVEAKQCCELVGESWPDAPLWRMPVFSVILPTLAAMPLGIARSALDEIAHQARARRAGVRRGDLAADPLAMRDLAAELRLAGARAVLYDLVRAATIKPAATRRSNPVPRPHLPRHLHATETAVEVTTVAHRLGGGAATYADSRLLRALNDIQAVQQHYQFAREHRIELACALTGITDRYPPYIT